jgi:amidophosphoribosyltransferase
VAKGRAVEESGLREACGVFGAFVPGRQVSRLVFDGLYALQHRGQESAGMAVSDGESIAVEKDMGLVSNVFDERKLSRLVGHLAIGHTRYSTAGPSTWHFAQPTFRPIGHGGFALAHNGNLTNTEELAASLGWLPGMTTSDTDLLAEMVARRLEELGPEAGPVDALLDVLPHLRGAFSLVMMDASHLVAVRDPHGFRPLCLGRLEEGYVVASETPALDIVGATYVREVAPGEVIVIDDSGLRSLDPFADREKTPHLCVFEFVYFARPDALLMGREVHAVRRRLGMLLAREAPAQADMVMGVPESGIPAAEGYAYASGIPYGQGLVKNRYIGRTFIDPSPDARVRAVRRKLNPLKENIKGKRLVVVDDSFVRGTTSRALVQILREAGAVEVHLRYSCPPFRYPCFYGIDVPDQKELAAAGLDTEGIAETIDADSVAFLSFSGMWEAIELPAELFCDACFSGNYPEPIPRGAKVTIAPRRG